MSKDFDDILNICLDRITLEGDTIEHCLETYPEHAAELEPLLRAAYSVIEASSVEPRPEFQQAAKARFLSTLAAKQAPSKQNKENRGLPFWNWQQRWATAVAAIMAILLIGGGTVTASADSLPGDMLYSVKIATENVREFLTFSDEAKANLYVEVAERRVEEVELLIEKERDVTESVLNRMHDDTERAIEQMDQNEVPDEELAIKLVDLTSNQNVVLEKLVENAPSQAKTDLEDDLRRSETAYNRAVVIKQTVSVQITTPEEEGTPEQEMELKKESTPVNNQIPLRGNESDKNVELEEYVIPVEERISVQGNGSEQETESEGTPAKEQISEQENTSVRQDTSVEESSSTEEDGPALKNGLEEEGTPDENNDTEEENAPALQSDSEGENTPDQENDSDEDDAQDEENDSDEGNTPTR